MKNKIAKILGVVLAAVTVVSLFAFALPVSAAAPTPQTWNQIPLPGPAGYVQPGGQAGSTATLFGILTSGPLVQASDGTLYCAVTTTLAAPLNSSILKSTDGGRHWAPSGTQGQPVNNVVAMKALGTTIYYATGGAAPATPATFGPFATANTLFRSTDGGVTFINMCSVPLVALAPYANITCIDAATLGGRNIIAVGTLDQMYYVDEALFYNMIPLGTPDLFQNFIITGGAYPVAVTFSPNFATDRGVAALLSNGVLTYDVFGGAWGANIAPGAASGAVGSVTTGAIKFPSDFNDTTNANLYYGGTGGIYAFRGNPPTIATPNSTTILLTTVSSLPTSFGAVNVVSLDESGPFAGASLIAGLNYNSKGEVIFSTNAGGSWSTPTKAPTLPTQGTTGNSSAWVLYKNDYATSGAAYALIGATGVTVGPNLSDETAFSISVDKAATWNQVSLVNDQFSQINDLTAAGATGSTQFVSTSTNGGVNPNAATSFTLTNSTHATTHPVLASTVTVSDTTAGATATLNVLSGTVTVATTGTATYVGSTITLPLVTDTVVITATSAATINLAFSDATGVAVGANGATTTNAGAGNWNGTLPNAASAGTDTYSSNSVVTLTNINTTTKSVSVSFSNKPTGGSPTFDPLTGVITFSTNNWFDATNTLAGTGPEVATVTMTGSSASFNITATLTGGTDAVICSAGAMPLTAYPMAKAASGTNRDNIWRWDGTNWERVLSAPFVLLPSTAGGSNPVWPLNTVVHAANMVRSTPTTASSQAVFYGAVPDTGAIWTMSGGINISQSTNNGQSWRGQATNVGANVGTIDQIQSMVVIDANTVITGSIAGGNTVAPANSHVCSTATNGLFWVNEVSLAVVGAGGPYLNGAVSDIGLASNNDVFVVVTKAATPTYVLKNTVTGVTVANTAWAELLAPTGWAANTEATLAASTGGAFVDPANDYATSGNVFVSLASGGVFRYPVVPTVALGPAPVLGWQKEDALATVGTASGQVTAPGGPGSTTEGLGMLYVADGSAPVQISRIRGTTNNAENLVPANLIAPAAPVFFGMWAGPATTGSVQLWTLSNTTANGAMGVYTYVDTLGVPVAGVSVPAATLVTLVGGGLLGVPSSSTCVVTWTPLANATNYKVVVDTVQDTDLWNLNPTAIPPTNYTVNALGVPTAANYNAVLLFGGPLAPGTKYYASVWAIGTGNPVGVPGAYPPPNALSSFMGTVSFTTPVANPVTPMDLVPALGASNIPVLPNFAWMSVAGATSYNLQITLATDTAFASPVYVNAAVPAQAGPTVTWNYTGTALATNTSYIWRVLANGPANSVWVYGNFTTIPAVVPPVTVTQAAPAPVPTIIITAPSQVTVTAAAPVPTPIITFPGLTVTQLPPVASPTPVYIWVIVGVGALLTLAVIILIIRTRRVV